MNINPNTNYNNNFKGGFHVREVSPFMKTNIQQLTQRGCKAFYNFAKQGDVFILAPESMNQDISATLKKVFNKNFNFYPNFTPDIFNTSKLIKKVLEFVNLPPVYNKVFSRFNDRLAKKLDILEEIGYKADIDNSLIKMYKGVTKINDLKNERQFVISPTKDNKTYVKVLPHSKTEDIEYYIVDEKIGAIRQKITNPDQMIEFNRNFTQNARNYDPEFLKNCNFARTNLELLAENSWNPEEFFEHAAKEVPELTEKLCSDELFAPNFQAYRLILNTKKEEQEEAFEKYKKFHRGKRIQY